MGYLHIFTYIYHINRCIYFAIACQNPMVTPNTMILWDPLNSQNWGSLAIKSQSCRWSWVCPKITLSECLDTSIYLFLTHTYPFLYIHIHVKLGSVSKLGNPHPLKWFHLLLDPSGILHLLIWRHLHILGGIDLESCKRIFNLPCTALTKTTGCNRIFFHQKSGREKYSFSANMGNQI